MFTKIVKFASAGGPGVIGDWWRHFRAVESGTDLVEYSLLLAFIVLVGAGAFIGMGGSINMLWSISNSRLANP